MPKYIPVNTPLLNGNEKKYLIECIETGWISSEGPFIEKFEKSFSQKIHRKHAVAVSNGSDAIELSIKALDIGPGDEVIMPAFTIISCATAIVRVGAIPVLIDSDENTWNMDVSKIEEKITNKTKAIMVVHIYGLPVDMDPVLKLCKKYNLYLIEDAAEAHGLTYKGKPCGSFGNISIFSFYPNKLITTGEGGMVVTDDKKLYERSVSLRNLCFIPERRFIHYELGWNMRMTNLQAAVGLAQLEKWNEHIKKKRNTGKLYTRLLKNVPLIQLPVVKTTYAENIYWVYGILLDEKCKYDATEMMGKLHSMGIGTRPFFYPLHLQPVFQRMGLFQKEKYPVSDKISKRGLYLPSGLGLKDSQLKKVVHAIKEILK